MISEDRVNGSSITRRLAVLITAVACIAGVCAPTASALNPQPLPPGRAAIGIHTPPDPCNPAADGIC